MKCFYIVLLFLVFSVCVQAQKPQSDPKATTLDVLQKEAHQYYIQKNYDEALNLLTSAVLLDSTAYQNYLKRSIIYTIKNDQEKADSDLKKALSLNSDTRELVYFSAGTEYDFIGNPVKALEMYDKAINLKPDFHQAINNKALQLENLGKNEEARALYKKASEIDTTNPGYFLNLGRIYRKLNNKEQALDYLAKSLALDPKFTKSYMQRGDLRADNKDYFRAIVDYSKIIEIDPTNSEAYLKRGYCEVSIDMKPEGCADIKKAVDLGNEMAPGFYEKMCK